MVGKWHLGYWHHDYTPLSRGFDSFTGCLGGGPDHFYHLDDDAYDWWSTSNGTMQVWHNQLLHVYVHASMTVFGFRWLHTYMIQHEYIQIQMVQDICGDATVSG